MLESPSVGNSSYSSVVFLVFWLNVYQHKIKNKHPWPSMTTIQAVVNAARRLFTNSSNNSFEDAFQKLKEIACKITPADLGMSSTDSIFPKNAINGLPNVYGRRCPPAKVLGIHEEKAFSIMVFILNEGEKIPLHDHPGMTGVIKCLTGKVSVSSFSPLPTDVSYSLPKSISIQVSKESQSLLIPCIENQKVIVSSSSELESICTLSPSEGNIHEIEAVEGCPAFLDILSPPYDDERDCQYYKVVGRELDQKLKKEITWLMEVSPPSAFWTSSVPYKGPRIQ